MSYETALQRTLGFEGGVSDDPADSGGRTNYGVTQSEYDSWRDRHSLPRQTVDLISDDEVRALYFEDYWTPCRCEEMPEALGAAVFDMAVNSGVWNAKIALQNALRVRADGVIGDATLLAAHNAPDAVLKFLKQRAGLISDLVASKRTQVKFLHGWINRLLDQAWGVS